MNMNVLQIYYASSMNVLFQAPVLGSRHWQQVAAQESHLMTTNRQLVPKDWRCPAHHRLFTAIAL